MKPPAQSVAEHAPWLPAEYEPADAYAVKALARGEADSDQQRRALEWIIQNACATYDLSFRPGQDGDRDTAMAEGRRFVGLQIVKLLNLQLKRGGETNEQG